MAGQSQPDGVRTMSGQRASTPADRAQARDAFQPKTDNRLRPIAHRPALP
jgi:hypothetical protein